MKTAKLFLMAFAIASMSCKQEAKETDAVTTDSAIEMETLGADTSASPTGSEQTSLYACSMHPEITGAKGEKCSKCEMELTEPVAAN